MCLPLAGLFLPSSTVALHSLSVAPLLDAGYAPHPLSGTGARETQDARPHRSLSCRLLSSVGHNPGPLRINHRPAPPQRLRPLPRLRPSPPSPLPRPQRTRRLRPAAPAALLRRVFPDGPARGGARGRAGRPRRGHAAAQGLRRGGGDARARVHGLGRPGADCHSPARAES